MLATILAFVVVFGGVFALDSTPAATPASGLEPARVDAVRIVSQAFITPTPDRIAEFTSYEFASVEDAETAMAAVCEHARATAEWGTTSTAEEDASYKNDDIRCAYRSDVANVGVVHVDRFILTVHLFMGGPEGAIVVASVLDQLAEDLPADADSALPAEGDLPDWEPAGEVEEYTPAGTPVASPGA